MIDDSHDKEMIGDALLFHGSVIKLHGERLRDSVLAQVKSGTLLLHLEPEQIHKLEAAIGSTLKGAEWIAELERLLRK